MMLIIFVAWLFDDALISYEQFLDLWKLVFTFTPFICSILGTPFYVMEYAQGRLFKDPSLPGMTVEERKVCITFE